MTDFKCYSICKFLAIVLSVLIVGQAHFVFSSQEETPEARFKAAKVEYVNGNTESAKSILEGLVESVAESEENRVFLGYVHLLLGACEETLKNDTAASEHYLKAKELLGEREATIEGVSFSSLNIYLGVFATQRERDEAAALNAQFEEAKRLYFAGDYEGAKLALERLVSTFAALEGWDVLKGETYLLLGASYEKLKYKELAVKYYCRAKEILGKGKTIAGLELKKLKYYDEECRVVAARPAARKGSWIGKALGTILFLGALGGLVWYLFFSPNAPLKAKGKYTSITVKVEVTFKGLNSKGSRSVILNGDTRLDESFVYSQPVANPSECSATNECPTATSSQSYSWTVETNGEYLDVIQKYLNWDYWSCGGTCCKILCADWSFSIESYKWESGKKDPGSPIVQGTDQLSLDFTNDCTGGPFIHNCETTAHLTFKAPAAGTQGAKVYHVSQRSARSSHN